MASWVRVKYWGQVSAVTGAPWAFSWRMISTLPAVEMWQKVQRHAGLQRQHPVPHDHQLFRNGRAAGDAQLFGNLTLVDGVVLHHLLILLVTEDGHAAGAGLFQRFPHEGRAHDGHAVIGERRRTGSFQGGEVVQLLPLLSRRHRRDGQDADAGTHRFRPLQQVLHQLRRVHHRFGVGHTGDGGEATGGGGSVPVWMSSFSV